MKNCTNFKPILLAIFLALISSLTYAQVTHTVITGTSSDKGAPMDPYFYETYSQQIYLQSEINAAGSITEIFFRANSYQSFNNSIDVYIGQTGKSEFSGASDWVPVGSMTQVYSGAYNIPGSGGWQKITIIPFEYDNVSNLVIAVDQHNTTWGSNSSWFYCAQQGNNRVLKVNTDGANPNPASPPSGNLSTFVPDLQLTITPPQFDAEISAGSATEPSAIFLTDDTSGEQFFSFDFTFDDNGGDTKDLIWDALQLVPGATNTVADWTTTIDGAILNGTEISNLAGTVGATGITFDPTSLITIGDGANETYTMTIWLNSGANIGNILDFKLLDTNITLNAASSAFVTNSVESGSEEIFDARNDEDSKIEVSALLAEPATISSLAGTDGEKVQVFDFKLTDLGTTDGLTTILNQIVIEQGASNNVTDWISTISAAKLSGPDVNNLLGTIGGTSITFDGAGFISIADNESEVYTLSIWLTNTVTDNSTLDFKVSNSSVVTDAVTGSDFGTYSTESGPIDINVEATTLMFTTQPSNEEPSITMTPDVVVNATDENGNIDLDYTSSITLTSSAGGGNYSVSSPGAMPAGETIYGDLIHTLLGTYTLTASDGVLTDAVSNSFIIYDAVIKIDDGNTCVVGEEMFYDAGGPTGVDGNTSHTITLCPCTPGEKVGLDFLSHNTKRNDPLIIYDGSSTLDPVIGDLRTDYATQYGSGGMGVAAEGADYPYVDRPTMFSATNNSGCLTLEFINGVSGTSPGWEARVYSYEDLSEDPGCDISLSASELTICEGDPVTLTATASVISQPIKSDFNSSSIGTGWSATPSVNFYDENSAACLSSDPALDGSIFLWMADALSPRALRTNAIDVSAGGVISFEYRQASDNGASSPCEAPDARFSSELEGVHLQYSIDGGGNWITFKYIFPEGTTGSFGSEANLTGCGDYVKGWTKMTYPIPEAAATANTIFRWAQPRASNETTDNWGLDNIVISSPLSSTLTWDNGLSADVYNHTVNPTTTTTYNVTISDGSTSCSDQVTVTVDVCCPTPPSITQPSPISQCDSYTLPLASSIGGSNLNNPQYFTNSQALGGTQITDLTLTSTQTVWVYDESSASCYDEVSFLVTINQTEDPSFDLTPGCEGATASITGTTNGSFAFNPAVSDGAQISNTTGVITNADPGQTYTVEYTTPGTCSDSSTEQVVILTNDDASFTMTENCSGGTANITGTANGNFAFNPSPSDGATIDANSGEVTNGESGVTYTVEYTTNGSCPATDTQDVTVTMNDDASFTVSETCDGAVMTITGTSNGTFAFTTTPTDAADIDPNTGEVTNATPLETYTIQYTTSGTCPDVSTQDATMLSPDDASFTVTENCSGGTASITGTPNGTFTFGTAPTDAAVIDPNTGEITNGGSGATYTIEYTTSGTCPSSTTQDLTVITTDNASFNVSESCTGAVITITGTSNGTFAFTTPPTDGAIIDVNTGEVTNATPLATYTIEYTTSGACPSTSTEVALILEQDDASFTLLENCTGATASITGTLNGTFDFSSAVTDGATINSSTGEIENGQPNTLYSVEYTTNSSCSNSSTMDVTIPEAEDATFTLAETCSGSTASITGTLNGTFTLNPDPSDGTVIDNLTGELTNVQSGSTYSVEYATPGVCSESLVLDVTIPSQENADFSMQASCTGGLATIMGDIDGTFSFVNLPTDGATINALTGELLNGVSETTYDILYTTNGPCPETETVNITVEKGPVAGVDGDQNFCNTSVSFDLNDIITGEDTNGTWTNPSGNTVTNTVDPASGEAGDYTYTVTSTTSCPDASSIATVVINQTPNSGVPTSGNFCSSAQESQLESLLAGEDLGGQWVNPDGDIHTGTLVPSTDIGGDYVYTVSGSSPCPSVSTTVNVTISKNPVAGVDGSETFCSSTVDVTDLNDLITDEDANGVWTSPDGNTHSGLLNPSSDISGDYTYTVSEITGVCPDASSVASIVINNEATVGTAEDLEVNYTDADIDLTNQLSDTDLGGEWLNPSGEAHNGILDPSADEAGTYTYTIGSTAPCKDFILDFDVLINMNDLEVYEVLTPNGDGDNDNWIVLGLENYPDHTITIFNRWGNKVYDAQDYQNDWDGTAKYGLSIGDNKLPSGTYFYILETGINAASPIKGFIYLTW